MGTWALPQTKKQAKELQQLMKDSLPANIACDKLYNLLGDDDLFDQILKAEKKYGDNYDVRGAVEFALQNFINNPADAIKPWNKEVYKICQEICRLPN